MSEFLDQEQSQKTLKRSPSEERLTITRNQTDAVPNSATDSLATIPDYSLPHYNLHIVDLETLARSPGGYNWIVNNFIAKSHYGYVYSAHAGTKQCGLKKGDKVAVKVCGIPHDDGLVRVKLLLEVFTLKYLIENQLSHHNVINFYETFTTNQGFKTFQVNEMSSFGDLYKKMTKDVYVKQFDKEFPILVQLPLDEVKWYAYGITNGLKFLKIIGIAHCDLKLTNILLFSQENNTMKFIPRISNFSNAVKKRAEDSSEFCSNSLTKTTITIAAPEVYDDSQSEFNGFKADIYSFGCCLYQMVTGSKPFGSAKFADRLYSRESIDYIQERKRDRNYLVDITRYLDNSLVELLLRCWELDPNKRITIEEVHGNQWISSGAVHG